MRFSAVHKLASYLMVACAYLALALSGELPTPIVFAGGILITASWFFEPPRFRPERWTMWWNALAVAAFGYTILSAFSGGEWVVSGSNLLLFLLVAKLFNRRTSRDYQVVYVLSFLMLVAGTTLNAELSYAVCFLGYVVFATWALILFHLRREMEDNFLLKHSDDSSSERVEVERILNSRRIVGKSFLIVTSTVSLVIFFLSAALFFLFPRVGFGFFFQKSRSHATFAGFHDGVSLGGHGLIRNDDTVVMRVKITDQRFQGATAPELHWRGAAFEHYSHGKWSRSAAAFGTHGNQSAGEKITRVVLDAALRMGDWQKQALRQDVYLEPLDATNLFAASTPVVFELDNVLPAAAAIMTSRYGVNDELHYEHRSGLHYVTYSDTSTPERADLSAATDADPKTFGAYLQLPPELPQRVIDLAHQITDGKIGPYAKAEAIYHYLLANYSYTLEMDSDDKREPLDDFLFVRKKGHCEYFSSAMAILLRASGVPTRNVNGFLGGEWNEYGKYFAVRGGDAHSWVEVYFNTLGWVTYDPTPPAESASLTRGGGGALDKLRRLFDNLRLGWFKWVIEYDIGSQMGLMKRLAGWLGFENGFSARSVGDWAKRHRTGIIVFIGALASLVLVYGRIRRRRRTGTADAPRLRKPSSHPVVALYEKAAKSLARVGFGRTPSQTPREHAAHLVGSSVPGAQPFAELTELYYTVRFGESEALAAQVDLALAERLASDVRSSARKPRVLPN